MTNKKLKRVLFDVLPEIHSEIKAAAAYRGLTLKAYVLGSVLEQLKKDKQYK